MPAESLSPLHPSPAARGHAHPSPATTAIATDTRESQRLTELLATVAIDVELRGLAGKGALPHEMYHPRLRKSDVTQQAISHLDTISCWRGISLSQARELIYWRFLFHHYLSTRIQNCLKRSIVDQLSKREDRIDSTNLFPCIAQCFPKDSRFRLDIHLSCLLRDMTAGFCNRRCSDIATTHPWSSDSGNLAHFFYNFLCVQDCFQNTPAGPCAFISFSIERSGSPWLNVTADVAWHPPAIEFRHVPTQTRPGAHYVIVPYRERTVEDHQQPEYKQYPKFTEYVVKKSTSKVQWDHRAELFRAQAPERVGIKDAPETETIIQVTTITRFPENVRFESTSRYAIKVSLMDTWELDIATDNNHSRNSLLAAPCTLPRRRSYPPEPSVCKQGPGFSLLSLSELMARRTPPFSSEQRREEEFAETTGIVAPMHNEYYPSPEVSGRSTNKRPNSLCESEKPSSEGNRLHNTQSSGPDTDLKRRKLDQTDVTGMEGMPYNWPDRAMGIEYPTPPYTPSVSNSIHSDHRARLASPVDTRASPSRHTRTGFKFSSQLSQQAIQHNYHEFEKMALRKLVDEPCLGDASFENVFLDDSEAEDWHSSDLEGLSDELNNTETEL